MRTLPAIAFVSLLSIVPALAKEPPRVAPSDAVLRRSSNAVLVA